MRLIFTLNLKSPTASSAIRQNGVKNNLKSVSRLLSKVTAEDVERVQYLNVSLPEFILILHALARKKRPPLAIHIAFK